MKDFINFRRNGESIAFFKQISEFSGNAFLPQKALVPISIDQAKAIPIVSFGQYVQEGQVIARSLDKNSTDVHAPIPGIVGDLTHFMTDYESTIDCIPIFLEGQFNMLGKKDSNYSWRNTSMLELLRIIEAKGLILTEKPFCSLATSLKKAIHENVQNIKFALFDFDPSCGLETHLLKHFFFEVLEGLEIVARILDAKQITLYYTNNLEKSIKEKIKSFFNFTEVIFSKTKNNYPFYDITKLALNEKTFIVLPSTAIYVYDAIIKDRPFLSSYIVLSGPALKENKFLKARLGSSLGSLIEECGGLTKSPCSIIINGFLEGVKSKSFDIPVNKTMKSITLIPSRQEEKILQMECNSCGKCISACPMHLNPMILMRKIRRSDYDENVLMQLRACIKCSVCSCACECRIPLSKTIIKAKEGLNL